MILTEQYLHHVIMEAIDEMGTPKQNAFLKNLLGDEYDEDKHGSLPVPEASKLIDSLLKKKNGGAEANNGCKYIVYEPKEKDNDYRQFSSFREAKKYFDEVVDEWYKMTATDYDIGVVKISDICYEIRTRNCGRMGSIYIKKVKA